MALYRNALKNKKAIQRAFAELLSEKNDITKITVCKCQLKNVDLWPPKM